MKGLQSTASGMIAFAAVFVGVLTASSSASATSITLENSPSTQSQIMSVVVADNATIVPPPASGNDAPNPRNTRTASIH